MPDYGPMTLRRKILLFLIATVLAVAATTLFALEGRDVAVLETTRDDGSPRRTRVWFVDAPEGFLIEAAHPAREFLVDIAADNQVHLSRHGESSVRRATILPNPQGHTLIRQRLHEKYGWADIWIGFFTDTRQSLALRLDPIAPPDASHP